MPVGVWELALRRKRVLGQPWERCYRGGEQQAEREAHGGAERGAGAGGACIRQVRGGGSARFAHPGDAAALCGSAVSCRAAATFAGNLLTGPPRGTSVRAHSHAHAHMYM
eukprot:scaffold98053_cov69-Phaeocystis_antarctica.AAC.1